MKEHAVTITLSVPDQVTHSEVQSRVIRAVGREFAADRDGVLAVEGLDRAGLEAKLADMTRERNALHAAWSRQDGLLKRAHEAFLEREWDTRNAAESAWKALVADLLEAIKGGSK